MTPDDQDDPRIGAVLQGRYRVISRLAAGGMGTVYRGERVQLGKSVAIKFLHSSFAAEKEFLRRFEVEAKAMSRLSHPHCVSVIDFGVEGAPYMVMEFVQGETLRSVIDRGPLPPGRAVTIVRQILAGLAHAHGQGIIHRDVKPANIILGEATGTGEHARILDFGLAKLRDSAAANDQSMASMAVGTPSYMSPEQIRGEKVDGRADVYAAGVLLFELITGKKMFTADETFEILKMHLELPPPTIASAMPSAGVSKDLEDALARALKKKPDERYQTAAEFADALEDVPEAYPSHRQRLSGERPREGVPLALPYATTQSMQAAEPSLSALAAATTMPAQAESPPLPIPPRLQTPPPAPVARDNTSTDSSIGYQQPVGGGGRAIGFLALLVAGASFGWWYMHQREDAPPKTSAKGGSRVVAQAAKPDAAPRTTAKGGRPDTPLIAPTLTPDATEGPRTPDAAPPPDAPAPVVVFDAAMEEEDEDLPDAPPSEQVPPEERDEPIAAVPEGATTTEEQIDPPATKQAPPPAPAPVRELTANEITALIKAGKRDEAERALLFLKRKYPKNAYYPYLLGNLYFDKMWWTDGLEEYAKAIRNNRGYRWRPVLIKNAIHALGSEKTKNRAVNLLRRSIGTPAVKYLRHAAKHDPNGKVRERSAWLAKVMTPRRRGRF